MIGYFHHLVSELPILVAVLAVKVVVQQVLHGMHVLYVSSGTQGRAVGAVHIPELVSSSIGNVMTVGKAGEPEDSVAGAARRAMAMFFGKKEEVQDEAGETGEVVKEKYEDTEFAARKHMEDLSVHGGTNFCVAQGG